MKTRRLNSPTTANSSAGREMPRRQWPLAILGTIATIGAAMAVVRMKENMAA